MGKKHISYPTLFRRLCDAWEDYQPSTLQKYGEFVGTSTATVSRVLRSYGFEGGVKEFHRAMALDFDSVRLMRWTSSKRKKRKAVIKKASPNKYNKVVKVTNISNQAAVKPDVSFEKAVLKLMNSLLTNTSVIMKDIEDLKLKADARHQFNTGYLSGMNERLIEHIDAKTNMDRQLTTSLIKELVEYKPGLRDKLSTYLRRAKK